MRPFRDVMPTKAGCRQGRVAGPARLQPEILAPLLRISRCPFRRRCRFGQPSCFLLRAHGAGSLGAGVSMSGVAWLAAMGRHPRGSQTRHTGRLASRPGQHEQTAQPGYALACVGCWPSEQSMSNCQQDLEARLGQISRLTRSGAGTTAWAVSWIAVRSRILQGCQGYVVIGGSFCNGGEGASAEELISVCRLHLVWPGPLAMNDRRGGASRLHVEAGPAEGPPQGLGGVPQPRDQL